MDLQQYGSNAFEEVKETERQCNGIFYIFLQQKNSVKGRNNRAAVKLEEERVIMLQLGGCSGLPDWMLHSASVSDEGSSFHDYPLATGQPRSVIHLAGCCLSTI